MGQKGPSATSRGSPSRRREGGGKVNLPSRERQEVGKGNALDHLRPEGWWDLSRSPMDVFGFSPRTDLHLKLACEWRSWKTEGGYRGRRRTGMALLRCGACRCCRGSRGGFKHRRRKNRKRGRDGRGGAGGTQRKDDVEEQGGGRKEERKERTMTRRTRSRALGICCGEGCFDDS